MRGKILRYDETEGLGFIETETGQRLMFERRDLRRGETPAPGMAVAFEANGSRAEKILLLRASQPSFPSSPHWGRAAADLPGQGGGLWTCFARAMTSDYANFHGRARRKEYWAFALFWTLLAIAAAVLLILADGMAGNLDKPEPTALITVVGLGILALATALPVLAVTVRRLHDVGVPGWAALLVLFPAIGGLALLIFALCPSQKEANAWGPVPAGM